MSKYSVRFLLLICLSFSTVQKINSKGTESKTQIRDSTILESIFKEAVLKYGPEYYRKDAIVKITSEIIPNDGDYYGLNANRVRYIVTSYYDISKEHLEFRFLSKIKIWADNMKPTDIGFENGSVILFSEPLDLSTISDSSKRETYIQTQKYRIPYGSTHKQISYQTSEPRKIIQAEWKDTTFIMNLRNYASNKQLARKIVASLESNQGRIKAQWIKHFMYEFTLTDTLLNKYVRPYTQEKDARKLSLHFTEQYSLDSVSFSRLNKEDSVEYYLKVNPDKARGFISQSGKILTQIQLSLRNERWIPIVSTPVYGALSDCLSKINFEKEYKFFIVNVTIPTKYTTTDIPFFVYKGEHEVLMCFTEDYKSIPFKAVLLNLKKDLDL